MLALRRMVDLSEFRQVGQDGEVGVLLAMIAEQTREKGPPWGRINFEPTIACETS